MQYKAFISYKHHVSTAFAERLEQSLKGYAKPWLSPPFKVFRDEKHLRPGIDLPNMIRNALDDSEFLLLLASKQATESPWVSDELDHWCRHLGRVDNLIIVLVKDRIVVDSTSKAIDWTKSDALPVVLQPFLSRVPLYVDFSRAESPHLWDLGQPDYKKAVNAIVARFRGLDPNDMMGEEVRQHRRNLRLRNVVITALVVLALAATTFSIVSYYLNRSLKTQMAITQSNALAARGQLLVTEAPDLALLLVGAAWRASPTHEARSALLKAIQAHPRLGKHLHWSNRAPNDLEFHPDGHTLFVPGETGEVRRISFADGSLTASYKSASQSQMLDLALSADGTYLAAVTSTNVNVWQTTEPSRPPKSLEIDIASCVVVSPDGTQVVVGTASGGLTVWQPQKEPSARLDINDAHAGLLTELTFDASGNTLYSAAMESGTPLKSWDTKSWQSGASFTGVEFAANGLALSQDGKLLAAAFENGVVAIWSTTTPGSPLEKLSEPFSDTAHDVDFSSDGRLLASAHAQKGVLVWAIGDKTENVRSVFGHRGGSFTIAFQPKSHRFSSGGADQTVRAWDVDASNPLIMRDIKQEGKRTERIMFDGTTAVLTNSTGATKWSEATGLARLTSFPEGAQLLATAPGGDVLLSESRHVILRRVRGENRVIRLSAPRDQIDEAALGSSGRYAATTERGQETVEVWDAARPGEAVQRLSVAGQRVSALIFDPSEQMLAASTATGAVFVWNVADGREVSRKAEDRFAPITALTFSPDSRWLYIGYLMGALEKRLVTDLPKVVASQVVHQKVVDNLAVDPAGQLLASSSSESRIILWDANSLEPFGDLVRDDELLVRQLVFNPKGRQLATLLQDGTVRLWDTDVESWYRRALSVANRPFTARERLQYALGPQAD